MLRLKLSARASILALMASACLSFAPIHAYAQESELVSRQFSAQAGAIVLEAQTLMTSENYSDALAKLSSALEIADISVYERSIIHQMQGASYYQLDEFGSAIAAFEKALAAGGLLPKEMNDMQVQIAQLMIANEQFSKGAQRLEEYLNRGGELKPEYIEIVMQAWVQAENYQKAMPWAEKWFASASPKERKHFDILNFLYSKLEKSTRQAEIVKEMITLWPNERELWDAWASLLALSGQDQDAFEVNKLLYIRGDLTEEDDILKIVQYYSYYDMPYQAAQILEKELNAGRVKRETDKLVQLSTLFRQAREYGRAIPILEAATESGGTAELYAQLGEALYNEGLCDRAEIAFRQSIDRGYNAGKAWMLIATCRYEDVQRQKKLSCQMNEAEKAAAPKTKARESTIAAFKNVPSTSTQSKDAKRWISFIKAERLTFDKRCEFEERVIIEECFKDIRRAIQGEFVDGKFTLGNPECENYRTAYDKEYGAQAG